MFYIKRSRRLRRLIVYCIVEGLSKLQTSCICQILPASTAESLKYKIAFIRINCIYLFTSYNSWIAVHWSFLKGCNLKNCSFLYLHIATGRDNFFRQWIDFPSSFKKLVYLLPHRSSLSTGHEEIKYRFYHRQF